MLSCRLAKVHHDRGKTTPPTEKCTGKVIRGTVKFTTTGAATSATIKRKGKVLARGARVATPHGGEELVLNEGVR